MAQVHKFLAVLSAVAVSYLLLVLRVLRIPLVGEETSDQIIPVIPWTLLIAAGSYSLASLGWGLFTFRDCPDAYDELMQQISTAKNELRSKGVSVD